MFTKNGNEIAMNNKQSGFTLIELMIVVAILGILAAIAYPQYVEYVAKGRRAECRSALLVAAQKMEKFYSNNNTYPTTRAAAGINLNSNELTPNPTETVNAGASCTISIRAGSVTPPGPGGVAATFTLDAFRTPINRDRYCYSLNLNQLNTKGGTGPDLDRCWR
jgi:type IV pilus assembly protein PilE